MTRDLKTKQFSINVGELMNNPFNQLILLMQEWQHLGRGTVGNERLTAYGEVDRSKPTSGIGWVHSYFHALTEEELKTIELQESLTFPTSLKNLYLTLSCAEMFREMYIISGFWTPRFGNQTATFQPVTDANYLIGSYKTQTGMFFSKTRHHYDKLGWAHLDFESDEVDLYIRPTGGELVLEQTFDSLEDYIFGMYTHCERLFDKATGWQVGKVVGEP